MTARIRTVMDTQTAINTFFCGRGRGQGNSLRRGGRATQGQRGEGRFTFRAFFWFSRAILTCSCPRST